MQVTIFKRRGDHLNDLRREPRWIDGRLALSRVGDLECPGITGDVSLGGLRLALVGASFPPEEEIFVDVAYEEDLLSFRGRIRYALSRPWGCIVGVDIAGIDPALRDFFGRRYGRSAGTA